MASRYCIQDRICHITRNVTKGWEVELAQPYLPDFYSYSETTAGTLPNLKKITGVKYKLPLERGDILEIVEVGTYTSYGFKGNGQLNPLKPLERYVCSWEVIQSGKLVGLNKAENRLVYELITSEPRSKMYSDRDWPDNYVLWSKEFPICLPYR